MIDDFDLNDVYDRVQYDAECAGDGYAWSVEGTLAKIRDALKEVIPEPLVAALHNSKKAIVCPNPETATAIIMVLAGVGHNFAVVNEGKSIICSEQSLTTLRARGVNV